MRRTLQQQIAANRRQSLVFSFFMIVLLAGLGTVIVGIYSPHNWYYGTGGAALLAVICALVARFQGPDIMLAISRARPATHAEDQILDNVAEEMALAAGIPKPKVYVIDDPSPNAFATGMDPQHGVVVFTTGILQKLDRDELQGVMAHELSHVRNYDIRFMTIVSLIAGLIPLLADLFRNMIWFGGGSRSRDDDRDSNSAGIFAIVGIVLSIVAPIFALLLQLAISRKRELLADSSAAEMTRYPEGLARALVKLDNDPQPLASANRATQSMFIVNPFRGGGNWFSTHPSTAERVKALMGNMGIDALNAATVAPVMAQPKTTPPPLPGQIAGFQSITHTVGPGFGDMPDIPDQHHN